MTANFWFSKLEIMWRFLWSTNRYKPRNQSKRVETDKESNPQFWRAPRSLIKTQENWHTAYLGRLPWRNMFWRLLWRHLQPAPVPELSGPSLKFCKGSLVCCKLNVKRIPFCWGQEQIKVAKILVPQKKYLKGCRVKRRYYSNFEPCPWHSWTWRSIS